MNHVDGLDNPSSGQSLTCYLTAPQLCPYLPGREMQTIITDPSVALGEQRFGQLLAAGFRRSGHYVYQPRCRGCQACIPVRVPVARFAPNRAQRRCLRANADLDLRLNAKPDWENHFVLLQRYLAARHVGGGMQDMSLPDYQNMLTDRHCPVLLLELYAQQALIAVAVTDVTPQGLSALYTFFAPEYPERSLGTLAILAQIDEAQRRGLDHLYLGYWIRDSAKMAYKTRFQPCEGLLGHRWQPVR